MTDATAKRWQRVRQYLATGQTAPARATLEALLAVDPGDAGAHLMLGGLAWQDDHVRAASRHALAAAGGAGEDAGFVLSAANALLQTGETAAAHALLARPALRNALQPQPLQQLAALYQQLEQHVDALACHERAHAIGATDMYSRFLRAFQLAFNGRLAEAQAEFEACIASGFKHGRAYIEAARLSPATPAHNHLDRIAQQVGLAEPGGEDHAALEFARYRELEDLGRHAEAWQALAQANALMAARAPCDAAREGVLLERLLQQCDTAFLQAGAASESPGPQPVFIIGMPRSGTTLLDRMLGAHPQVCSTGELRDFGQQLRWMLDHAGQLAPDEVALRRLPALDFAELGRRYLAQTRWRASSQRFFTDKLTANWVVAGLIAKALPQAPIIHLVRDAMDVCFSNFRAFFSDGYPWTYTFTALAEHHRQYCAAMAHWHRVMPGRILDVSYAKLVAAPEATLRAVLSHCGLPWDPACLDVARNRAPIATLSFAQAREAPHQRWFEAWRPYATQMGPLRALLERQRVA